MAKTSKTEKRAKHQVTNKLSMRRARQKMTEEDLEERRRKYRETYKKQKEKGLLKNIADVTPRQKRAKRKNWKEASKRLGSPTKPIYINLIRKPLDRLVSYYYFLRNGDNFRPHLVRKKHGDKMTFDECVERGLADCDPSNMWLQVPFFCGHAAQCWKPGNRWALERAKNNLINHYLIVGVTEEMLDFITVLEAALPRMFKGATEHYLSSNKSHLRQTSSKLQPQQKTVEKIQQSLVWKMENELYEFALEQFKFVKRKVLLHDVNNAPQIYFYEKIRPK